MATTKCWLLCCFHLLCTLSCSTITGTTNSDCHVAVLQSCGIETSSESMPVHSRRRRHLLFPKGANLAIQTNFAKALISERPRGFNEIVEYTVQYDLPHMLHQLLQKQPQRRKHKSAGCLMTTRMPPHTTPWLHVAASQRRRNYKPSATAATTTKQLTMVRSAQHSACTAAAGTSSRCNPAPTKRRYKRDIQHAASHLLFDLIALWTRIHAYNERHCIMRTLCEAARYFKRRSDDNRAGARSGASVGDGVGVEALSSSSSSSPSLLHDLLRILLRYAMPAVQQHSPYANAWQHGAVAGDCVRLYGPHCRLSFLQQITAGKWWLNAA